jgi:hypothetical protein
MLQTLKAAAPARIVASLKHALQLAMGKAAACAFSVFVVCH